jgi:hypothetical protein
MLFLPEVQGTSPGGTRSFSPRSKDTASQGPQVFLPKVQGGCVPRSTGISPQGTRGLRPKPYSSGLVQAASFAMPRAHTRGGVQQREGVPGWPTSRGAPVCRACCQAGGLAEQRTGALWTGRGVVVASGMRGRLRGCTKHKHTYGGVEAPRGGVGVYHCGGDKNCRMPASTVA